MGDGLGNTISSAIGTISDAEKKLVSTIDPNKNGFASGVNGVTKILGDGFNEAC